MKAILTPYLILNLLLVLTLDGQAQSEDDYEYEYDHTYEYNHEYHYEWGMWGYRHEAKLIDSLSVLEMMDSLTRTEVAYQWEDFQEKKQKARKEKKDKKKKKDKDKEKDKKNKKGDRSTETGDRGAESGEGKEMGWLEDGAPGMDAPPIWSGAGSGVDGPVAPLDAFLTAGLGYVAPLRVMNQVPDAQERAALVAIYNQMNGKNWAYQNNWLQGSSIEDIATWLGVTVENGDVVALELRRNNLTGGLPNTIANLSALEYLNLGGNAITSLPQQIQGLTNLKALYLDECQLANLPSGLGNLSKLETLYLNYNQLTSLPSTIEKLDALTAFYLYGNPLVTLPPQIGGLSSLTHLFLFQSSVTSLPDEIGQLKQLIGLFPKETQLTSLPATINNLTNLRFLNVADSKLKALPVMDKLNNLKGVIVSGNQLEQIPRWSSHPNIENLFFFVEENFIDLNQIAQNLTGVDTHPFVDFTYRPQSSPQEVLPVAGALLDPFPVKHPQSSYQWQQQVNGEWQDIAGASAPTYTGEEGGLYRCRLTNAWLPDMIYYSHPLEPDVSGATTQWIEAECASIGSNWQVTADAQASGGEYVVYPQGEGAYRTSPSSDPADQLVYTLTVEQAQDYFLLARINAPSYNDDSFWVKIDDKDWITWSGGIKVNQGFAWNQVPGGAVFLSKGTHTIIFTYREDGAQLDKLSLSLSAGLPSGEGEVALACESTGVAASQWVEAECASVGSNWTQEESSNASAGKYVVYPSGNYAAGPSTKAEDHLVYSLEIGEAQSYFLMARVNAPSYGDDSFWVKIDDKEWFPWGSGIQVNKGFQWNLVPGGALSLSAGSHTITLACREDGTQLDKLALRLTSALPTGLGEEAPECEDVLPPYVAPAPPSIVNNPPDATTAPSVSGTLTPASQSNSNVNYVRVYAPRTEISNPANLTMSSAVANVSVNTQYLDGLGRPIQMVVRGGSGSASQDLVQPITYDAYGRQVKQYLPYAASTATGTYRLKAETEQYDFYTNGPNNVAQSDYPYAQSEFDASPLNRLTKQAAPGKHWRMGSGHEIEVQYQVNQANEVRLWTASNGLVNSGYYSAQALYKASTTDQDSHTVEGYLNKEGQTVLRRAKGPTGNQDTYYVYDDLNRLRYTIPPEASTRLANDPSLTTDASFTAQYLYVYQYDERSRMTSQQIPGGGVTTIVYDQWDRPVLVQSALQAEQNQWSFTKYDHLNRPVMTGIYTTTVALSSLRNNAQVAGVRYEDNTTSGLGYTINKSFPTDIKETDVRTVTYYDYYTYPHAGEAIYAADVPSRSKARGQVTGILTRILDGNMGQAPQWLKSAVYYDDQYRPVQTVDDNHLGGSDRTTMTYRNTVNNEVLRIVTEHQTQTAQHTVTQNYTYDHQGRLISVSHQLDSEPAIVLSAYQYNALGELIKKNLGDGQQTINYRYNIRGWLTKINDLNSDETYFNQELYYDFGFAQKSYSGKLAGTKWSRAGGKAHAYGYLYDEVNRITGADYRPETETSGWATAPGAFSVDKIAYDLNGNVTQLKRYGQLDERLYLLDDMTYSYQGNRLQAVQDVGEATLGFVDGANATTEYGYDQSGNMMSDQNKGISNIAYDAVLNLPQTVELAQGSINYTYDAAGNKLREQVVPGDGSEPQTTDYVQGFHYQNGQLSFIQHEEGRLMMDDRAYHYDLKDHIGNTRVTFSSKPVTTTTMASMEMSAAPLEEAVFEGVAESRQTLAFHNTTDPSIAEPEPQRVATLMPGEQGPSKSLQVHRGDTIRLKVNARYETTPSQVQGLEGVATEIAGALQKTASGLESSGASESISGLGATGALANDQAKTPQAHMNYLVYDEDYQLIDQGFVAVSEAAAVGAKNPDAAPEALTLEVPIEEDGFVYAYLSNGAADVSVPANGPVANNNTPVHFDDFTVEQQSYIVAVHDYYPGGLLHQQAMPSQLPSKYLFQGAELTQDLGLNWYSFGLRNNYMPDLMRWGSVEPAANLYQSYSAYHFAGNNPVSNYELNGAAFLNDIYHFSDGSTYTQETSDPADHHYYVSATAQQVMSGMSNASVSYLGETPKGERVNVLSEVTVSASYTGPEIEQSVNVAYAQEQLARQQAGPSGGGIEPFYFVDNPISVGADMVSQVQGGEYAMAAFTLVTLGKGNKVKKVAKYDVGAFDDLQKASAVGDNLDLHHVVQSHPGRQAIPGYNRATAPAIALPAREHRRISTVRGAYIGNARDQLAKDIMDLRMHTNAPNSSLQQLIQLNKQMYPGSFRKR